jgi:hypothetical protein
MDSTLKEYSSCPIFLITPAHPERFSSGGISAESSPSSYYVRYLPHKSYIVL